jgi:thiol-disulfide isomerase/thioredoxin
MKKVVTLLLSVLCISTSVFSQTQFEVLPDKDGGKILKGIISVDILEKDPAFNWFAEGQKAYTPYADAVTALKKNADSIQLLVFMGTWCEDSHFVIPKLFFLLDKAGFPRDQVTLIGVDRTKKTISHLTEALNITNVPTIIVMKKGKETGRVIEYGPDGLFDKALGQILSPVK